ncbi:hypothetical protein BD289DRAFT_105920 [Coniella lustricola]|uniref:Uncharacterized protein n=1 Tax=Coniella lustricola TaxID=2025994 RepID=A0A2T2ZXR3_9PEZI|nr:hypothetical protein BD289DRAFT_105920 [Coniella lustricola]
MDVHRLSRYLGTWVHGHNQCLHVFPCARPLPAALSRSATLVLAQHVRGSFPPCWMLTACSRPLRLATQLDSRGQPALSSPLACGIVDGFLPPRQHCSSGSTGQHNAGPAIGSLVAADMQAGWSNCAPQNPEGTAPPTPRSPLKPAALSPPQWPAPAAQQRVCFRPCARQSRC